MVAWRAGATGVASLLQRFRPSSPSSGDAEEAALVARAQADLAAFAAIYDRHFAGIYGYCYWELGGAELAEDAAQQIFEQALLSLPRYREAGRFRSWLYTIAYRVIGAQRRAAHTRTELTIVDDLADPGSSPEDHALASLDRQELLAAISRLPRDQKLVIELRMAGLKGRDIAAELGRSPEAVRMLQHRALDRLGADLIAREQRRGGRHGA
jgi:RNA polymerase sigma-70 factor (ECF subfamily)